MLRRNALGRRVSWPLGGSSVRRIIRDEFVLSTITGSLGDELPRVLEALQWLRSLKGLLMAAVKDQAVVLRRLDYSETSQVLVFLTREHGLQRLIAKGIKRSTKKQFAAGVDLLERGHLVFLRSARGEGRLGTLTEWQQTESHLGLRDDLQRWYVGQYAAEITASMLAEADPHPELFDALVELLASLSVGHDPQEGLVRYQCALLRSVGLWPDLTRCVACDRPAPAGRAAYFSAQQGGLVCRHCQPTLPETRKVSAAALTGLREGRWEQNAVRSALELLDYMISHTMGRPTSLAKVFPGG